MKNTAIKVMSISLYVLAAIIAVYTVLSFLNCNAYINDAISTGQLVYSGNEYDIVNFYVSNCLQYLIYAIILAAIGFFMGEVTAKKTDKTDSRNEVSEPQSKEEDKELDEWLEEINNTDSDEKKTTVDSQQE